MVTLKSSDIKLKVRANHLARLYYKQEFNEELDKKLKEMLSEDETVDKELIKSLLSDGIKIDDIDSLIEIVGENEKTENKDEKINEMIAGSIPNNINVSLEAIESLVDRMSNSKYKTILPAFESMKIIWAMNMAQNTKDSKDFDSFDNWLVDFADFDVHDCLKDFIKEVEHGFFRFESEPAEQQK